MANLRIGRKSGFIQRSGVMRRETLWIGGVVVRTLLASASTAVIQRVLSASGLALRPFTIIRTRGWLHQQTDNNAASENQESVYGQAIVTDQAVAIGVTAVPTPATDSDSDAWFVYEGMATGWAFISATGATMNGLYREFDSKAMRKVEDGFQPIDVVESYATSSGLTIGSFSRLLLKLH